MHIILLALVPSLLWLYFFWSQERDNREQARPLARAFGYGAASSLAAGIFEYFLPGFQQVGIWCYFFLIIGPLEELWKYIATYWVVSREPTFDEPADGMIFAAAVALGFAFVENLRYFANFGTTNLSTELLKSVASRSLTSIPSHVLDTAPWGAALGYSRLVRGAPRWIIPAGLLVAVIAHGLFDTIAVSNGQGWINSWFAICALVGLIAAQWVLFRYLLNKAKRDWQLTLQQDAEYVSNSDVTGT